MSRVRIVTLQNRGDPRGGSWSVPVPWAEFLPAARDLHVTTLVPGGIRGNHFHLLRREAIVVLHAGLWTLLWDEGERTRVEEREFTGPGAVLVLVEPGAAHAVVNTGTALLQTLGLTDTAYDPQAPDTYARVLRASGTPAGS